MLRVVDGCKQRRLAGSLIPLSLQVSAQRRAGLTEGGDESTDEVFERRNQLPPSESDSQGRSEVDSLQ